MTETRLRRVLYASQFAPFKAPEIVAGAMRELASDPNISLTWVCSNKYYSEIRRLLGGNERIQLVDWMPAEALVETYDRHGIFLFPSYFEGFGKVFLEAMSRGLCVVGTPVGGMPDLIRDGENGFLVPVGDAGAVAARVRELIADPARAARIGAAAAATARGHTWTRVAREITAFYERRLAVK